MAISEDTLNKLLHAYGSLVPAEHPLNASLLRAAIVNWRHRPSDDPSHLARLRATANDWTGERGMFLGIRVDDGAIVHGHGVALIQDDAVTVSAESRVAFREYVSWIATRHHALVLVPSAHAGEVNLDSRDEWLRIKPQGGRRHVGLGAKRFEVVAFDPIADVTSLSDAITRAEALGAEPVDVLDVALVLLAANNAAPEEPIAVVDSLFAVGASYVPLKDICEKFGVTFDSAKFRRVSQQVLAAWRDEYVLARWDVVIADDANGSKTLQARKIDLASDGDVRGESLWVYDPARLPRLPRVLAAQHTPALQITPTGARLYASGDCERLYDLMPAVGSRCLLRDWNNRWLAVEMPDTYLRSGKGVERKA
ncbi:hypothetical protein [Mycobacteroides salmoniphilum]|uniref:hypothetical protein n=1 Tax=Mycobacteroides salmoniphilum TaxID=404941 RepID=UPI001F1CE410|nr:hypothetical protein [Mycobacteroides salmoniphilum]